MHKHRHIGTRSPRTHWKFSNKEVDFLLTYQRHLIGILCVLRSHTDNSVTNVCVKCSKLRVVLVYDFFQPSRWHLNAWCAARFHMTNHYVAHGNLYANKILHKPLNTFINEILHFFPIFWTKSYTILSFSTSHPRTQSVYSRCDWVRVN